MELLIETKFFDQRVCLTAKLDTREVAPGDKFVWTVRPKNSENRVAIGKGSSITIHGAQLPYGAIVVECHMLR